MGYHAPVAAVRRFCMIQMPHFTLLGVAGTVECDDADYLLAL